MRTINMQFGMAAIGLATLLTCGVVTPGAAQKGGTLPTYTFTDLPGLPGLIFNGTPYTQSQALAVNDSGQIVGKSYTQTVSRAEEHPVIWTKDMTGKYGITDLLLGGNTWSVQLVGAASAINSQGEIVGYWQDISGLHPFLIRPKTVDILGNKVWYVPDGNGFNSLIIEITGFPTSISDSTEIVAGASLIHYNTGEVTALLGPGIAINNNHQVAGSLGRLAAVWDASGAVVLQTTLNPLAGNTDAGASCINALGQAAGASSYSVGSSSYSRATLWQFGATPTDLGSLASNSTSNAHGINTVNGVLQVVGDANILNRGQKAFLWKNGVMTDLNTLISASGVALNIAYAINTSGQIVGYAGVKTSNKTSEIHAFLLTPR